MAKPSTQRYLPFSEIRDNCIILQDGSLAAVVMTSSINFALKSEDEQDALIGNYVNFLNSLDFTIQILVQSRPMRVDNYLTALKKQEEKIEGDLLKAQIKDYAEYIKELVTLGDIMSKKFYIVVPYAPGKDQYRGFMDRLSDVFSVGRAIALSRSKFDKYKTELDRRVFNLSNAIGSLGLSFARLDTKGLIELFYNIYNPVVSYQQPIKDVDKIQVEQDSGLVQ